MKPRRILALVVVVLLVGAGLALMTAAALPVALALGFGVLALVAGPGRRLRRRSGRDVPRLCWTERWTSEPPVHAVPGTRGRVAVVLAEWGITGEAVEPALLVITELLSNAIDHAAGPVSLSVELVDGSVHVEVRDDGPEPPRLQPFDPSRVRGRGLQLVDALSARWDWIDDPPGKVVRAEVPTGWPD